MCLLNTVKKLLQVDVALSCKMNFEYVIGFNVKALTGDKSNKFEKKLIILCLNSIGPNLLALLTLEGLNAFRNQLK